MYKNVNKILVFCSSFAVIFVSIFTPFSVVKAEVWQNVTPNRTTSAVYQNTGSTDLYVNVLFTGLSGLNDYLNVASTSPTFPGTDSVGSCTNGADGNCSIFVIVPAGWYYQGFATAIGTWSEYQSATTTVSTLQTVDNPNLDFGLGILIFSFWFFGVYWLFSKKR